MCRLFFLLQLLCFVWISYSGTILVVAQPNSKQLVQFYGFVFHEDSLSGAIGAHIYNPATYRGTSTDHYGYFSLPVAVGDSMYVSYQGYQVHHLVIPTVEERDTYAQLIYLSVDTAQLDVLQITPYMSEFQFKQAVLALGAPLKSFVFSFTKQHLSSPAVSYMYLVQQQQHQYAMRYNPSYVPVTNLLFHPLIRAIKASRRKKR